MKVGILGGGQLGRMLVLAGIPLGIQFRVLDPDPNAPASAVANQITADYDDVDAISRFGIGLDVATYEFENVRLEAANAVAQTVPLHPTTEALAIFQDRLAERAFLAEVGLPIARYLEIATILPSEETVYKEIQFPAVLKVSRSGYDGKGQYQVENYDHLGKCWVALQQAPCVLEAHVPYDREYSLIAVRDICGNMKYYPLNVNHHAGGILRWTVSPSSDSSPQLQEKAQSYACAVMTRLQYVGILAIELFECGGKLIVNEVAPRVHNSGHLTIEGSECSQFENHLRAICGLPLGSTASTGFSAMVNLIGTIPASQSVLSIPGAHLHLYGKKPRAGRKLGHVTIVRPSEPDRDAALSGLLNAFV